jgi:predicted phage baseplate assembly protein
VVNVDGKRVADVSLFHGNLIDMVQGKQVTLQYEPAGTPVSPGTYHIESDTAGNAICKLPPALPVLWTKTTPGGLMPSVSTVVIRVTDVSGTTSWKEQPDLVHSDGVNDRHFVVETDELLRTQIRFGDGINGLALPKDAVISCSWLSGLGPAGNIGRDILTNFDATGTPDIALGTCWNPFDVTDGLAPEGPEIIRRRVPEAFLYYQSRAVTLADYQARANEIEGVSNAAAVYLWTGSWRTVRVIIDPAGTNVLSEVLRADVEQQLDAVHLIGEDVEVRAPEYVPLSITVNICIARDYWPADVSPVIDQAFSTSYRDDGTPAFFNPDEWTFGQALYASQIEGALASIEGVEHVVSIEMTRWWNQSVKSNEVIAVSPEEIILVTNDPSRLELGTITFVYQGGRG